jgi:hypothetical protein
MDYTRSPGRFRLLLIGTYNSRVRLWAQCDNGWADIDVQLKRRYDLVPILVETVKAMPRMRKAPSTRLSMRAIAP